MKQEIKKQAKIDFQDIPGITGFGLGENVLRIYIANPEVKAGLPRMYRGVPVEFVITGEIRAGEEEE